MLELSKLVTQETTGKPLWLTNFINVYQQLGTDNLAMLNNIYHEEVYFQDPLHDLQGKAALLSYFDNLYTNVSQCDFVINHYFNDDGQAALYWTMSYVHPKLNSGRIISVAGHSHLKAKDQQVVYHRDYLDVGAMLYENIPLLGTVIRGLKKRVSQ